MTRVFLKWGALAALVGAALYLILALYAQREFVFAMLFLVLTASAVAVFVSKSCTRTGTFFRPSPAWGYSSFFP